MDTTTTILIMMPMILTVIFIFGYPIYLGYYINASYSNKISLFTFTLVFAFVGYLIYTGTKYGEKGIIFDLAQALMTVMVTIIPLLLAGVGYLLSMYFNNPSANNRSANNRPANKRPANNRPTP